MTKHQTKTIVLGSTDKNNKYRHIKFIKFLTYEGAMHDSIVLTPGQYKHIELICKQYTTQVWRSNGTDLMFAYDDENCRGNGVLYLGYWNDGTIE